MAAGLRLQASAKYWLKTNQKLSKNSQNTYNFVLHAHYVNKLDVYRVITDQLTDQQTGYWVAYTRFIPFL